MTQWTTTHILEGGSSAKVWLWGAYLTKKKWNKEVTESDFKRKWFFIWTFWQRFRDIERDCCDCRKQEWAVRLCLADCLYTRLKIDSDSQLPTIPLLSRWLPQRVCVCVPPSVFFGLCLCSSWQRNGYEHWRCPPLSALLLVLYCRSDRVRTLQMGSYLKWCLIIRPRLSVVPLSDPLTCLSRQKLGWRLTCLSIWV